MEYEQRTTQVIVVPEGEPIFSEMATIVTIVDEAAGEFVEVRQCGVGAEGTIRIGKEEWPAIQSAITLMLLQCKE
jgi:hypothetical protein